MVVTGGHVWIDAGHYVGWQSTGHVELYNTDGDSEELPLMSHRYDHACGHYIQDDKVVILLDNING